MCLSPNRLDSNRFCAGLAGQSIELIMVVASLEAM